MNDAPCKGCEKRYVGCHGKCEAYLAYDAENAAKRQKRLEDSLARQAAYESVLKLSRYCVKRFGAKSSIWSER